MILLFVTSGEKWAFSDLFFCSEGDADRFSDAQFDLAQETSPLCLEAGFISSIIPSLNRGSGSGVSGWTNAFILDVFSGTAATDQNSVIGTYGIRDIFFVCGIRDIFLDIGTYEFLVLGTLTFKYSRKI